jgi:hypothetical protein
VRKLFKLLLRYGQGEHDVFSVVRVPGEQDEALRRPGANSTGSVGRPPQRVIAFVRVSQAASQASSTFSRTRFRLTPHASATIAAGWHRPQQDSDAG